MSEKFPEFAVAFDGFWEETGASIARFAGMLRGAGVLLLLAVVACDRGSDSAAAAERFACTAASAVANLAAPATVEFIEPAGVRKDPLLARWRATVGPPVVDRAGRSCEDAPIDSLLVVSWNVRVGYADIERFISDLRNGRVIPGVRIQQFVLLLQEALREDESVPPVNASSICPSRIGGDGPDIEKLSDSLGLALFYAPSMRNGCARLPREDRGNAIVSTLPITNLRALELPLVRQRRVAVLADVKVRTTRGDEWVVTVASTHFENRGPGKPGAWVFGRARQAAALAAVLPDDRLMVVGGDFNTARGAGEPAVKIMAERFANAQMHQRKITYISYSLVRAHLDYLFFRSVGNRPSPYWRARQRYGSDHYPIMGFLRLK